MTDDDPHSVLARPPLRAVDVTSRLPTVSDSDFDSGCDFDSPADPEVDEPEPPYVLVRSGDDVDRTVRVSIARSGELPVGGDYHLVGGQTRLLALGAPLDDTLRIEVDTGTGGIARVSLDPSNVGATPSPEFVAYGDRISVLGLVAPAERAGEASGERGVS